MNQLQNPRELCGLAILSQPDTVREVRKNHWMVKSQSGNGEYLVTREYLKNRQWIWTCACPDHATRHLICKHIYAVQFSLKLKDDVEPLKTSRSRRRRSRRLRRSGPKP